MGPVTRYTLRRNTASVMKVIFLIIFCCLCAKNTSFASGSRSVVLKFVGDIEPKKCHAGMHQTLNDNQERIQLILVGGCSFELR